MAAFISTAAYRVAAWLARDELHLSGGMLRPPGRFSRAKLAVARKLLSKVIADIPGSWNSLWIAGKIHERLQEYGLALDCFKQGLAIKPTQPDLAIEASLAAVYVGSGVEAEKYAQIAVTARPADPGHRADLALALLVAGKPRDAKLAAEEALKLAPSDTVTQALHRLSLAIIEKALPCPKDMAGLQKLAKNQGITNVR
jgi:tetratricopeptide (TPR) repeat protein